MPPDGRRRRIKRLTLTEGSAVPEGANQMARICLFKARDGAPSEPEESEMHEDKKPTATEMLKSLSAEQIDELRKTLVDDVTKSLDAQAKKHAAELETITKALNGERELRLQREYVDKAKTMPVPGASTDDVAGVLRLAATKDQTLADAIEKILKTCSAAFSSSNLFREIGTDNGGPTDSIGKAQAIAKSIRAQDPKLTEAESMVRAYEMHPELYDDYVDATEVKHE